MVKVFSGGDEAETYYVHSLLEAQGVRAAILGEYLTAGRGSLALTDDTLGAVWVHPEDVGHAGQIIDEYNENAESMAEVSAEGTWVCPNCDKQIEGQFTQCWKCQAMRPTGADERLDGKNQR